MDSNHDKQIQSLLCYRYTSRQLWHWKNKGFGPPVKPSLAPELICPPNTASF